jgi:UDP-2,4-diacetamido-2,4,6-trideoxy-beta-L-altropyranose hydrolase
VSGIGTLLIRADASAAIGTGHVMRCIALGQAWCRRGGRVVLACRSIPVDLSARVVGAGLELENMPGDCLCYGAGDARWTAERAVALGASVVVADGYCFPPGFQSVLVAEGLRLAVIDDNGENGGYPANLIVNQNPHARAELYADRGAETRLLLGLQYAMLRREFLEYAPVQRDAESTLRIIVTMGGGDPDDVTSHVLEGLNRLTDVALELRVVVGGANSNEEAIRRTADRSPHRVTVECNVYDMPRVISWADFGIMAAGSTCWEMAYFGVPMLLVVIAKNQAMIAQSLQEEGVAVSLGWHENITAQGVARAVTDLLESPEYPCAWSQRSCALVDGRGADRVVNALTEVA